MSRVYFKAIIFTFISLFTANIAFALDSEYKNALTRIELTKTDDSAYNVNLYTAKKFSEPVKVIKKSDLSYYILLPETKNTTFQTSINTADIKSVSTKLYKYAGIDVENGYTKINISTVKPIDFNIKVKSNTEVRTANKTTIASNASAKKSTVSPRAEKKNSDFGKDKATNNKHLAKKTVSDKKAVTKKIEQPKKVATNNLKQTKPTQKAETAKKVAPVTKVEEKASEVAEVKDEILTPAPIVDVDGIETENEFNKLTEDKVQDSQNEQLTDANLEEIERIANLKTEESINSFPIISKIKSKLSKYKKALGIKLNEYGLNIKDLILMSLAGLFSFIIMVFVLSRKAPQTRLKNKADLLEKTDRVKLKPKKQGDIQVPQNNGQYFIFDKNIKQTGFCDPATSAIKRNYELSSYEPDLRDNYKRAQIEAYRGEPKTNNESEYDIIQKILKENSVIEVSPTEFEKISAQAPIKQNEKMTSPIKETAEEVKVIQEVKEVAAPVEPNVLSSVEIAPERGFMCVSYNDNINLVGYIYDDVFALYNFKTPKLENYEIQYRLVEKDGNAASFIVKLNGTKMVVKVTKSSMNLEVVM